MNDVKFAEMFAKVNNIFLGVSCPQEVLVYHISLISLTLGYIHTALLQGNFVFAESLATEACEYINNSLSLNQTDLVTIIKEYVGMSL